MFTLIFSPLIITLIVVVVSKKGWSDQKKIEKILEILAVKEGDKLKKFKLLRKDFINGDESVGVEYVYKIPLKTSMDQIENIYPAIRDGINIKREGNQKHVEIDYDGALKIYVYEKPLPNQIEYDRDLIKLCKVWHIPLGVNFKGLVFHDFELIPHMLIAGTTRYGKTVFLKNIITTLTVQNPENVIFTLIDLKGGLAFARFKDLRQVKYTAYNVEEALKVLIKIQTEMNTKMERFREKGFEDIGESKDPTRHFVIIDEGADMSSSGVKGKEKAVFMQCEKILSEIYRKGAGVGFRCIYATQYPLQKNLPDSVKVNSDAKVVFRLTNQTASQTVIDSSGAEKLPKKDGKHKGGRAIYSTDSQMIVQTPFIENNVIEELIKDYRVVKDVEVYDGSQQGEERKNLIEFR